MLGKLLLVASLSAAALAQNTAGTAPSNTLEGCRNRWCPNSATSSAGCTLDCANYGGYKESFTMTSTGGSSSCCNCACVNTQTGGTGTTGTGTTSPSYPTYNCTLQTSSSSTTTTVYNGELSPRYIKTVTTAGTTDPSSNTATSSSTTCCRKRCVNGTFVEACGDYNAVDANGGVCPYTTTASTACGECRAPRRTDACSCYSCQPIDGCTVSGGGTGTACPDVVTGECRACASGSFKYTYSTASGSPDGTTSTNTCPTGCACNPVPAQCEKTRPATCINPRNDPATGCYLDCLGYCGDATTSGGTTMTGTTTTTSTSTNTAGTTAALYCCPSADQCANVATVCPNGYRMDPTTGCQTCQCVEKTNCTVTGTTLVYQNGAQFQDGVCGSRVCTCNNGDISCTLVPTLCACPQLACASDQWVAPAATSADANCCRCPVCKTPCPVPQCSTACPNGYKFDANGCQTCTCREVTTCPQLNCQDTVDAATLTSVALRGTAIDANGCPTCTPATEPTKCPPSPCDNVRCAYGAKLDNRTLCTIANSDGTCACNPPPSSTCPAKYCLMQCANFAKDANGCDDCSLCARTECRSISACATAGVDYVCSADGLSMSKVECVCDATEVRADANDASQANIYVRRCNSTIDGTSYERRLFKTDVPTATTQARCDAFKAAFAASTRADGSADVAGTTCEVRFSSTDGCLVVCGTAYTQESGAASTSRSGGVSPALASLIANDVEATEQTMTAGAATSAVVNVLLAAALGLLAFARE